MLTFQPLEPKHTAGLRLQSIRIHVRDHKLRELSVDDTTLEEHFGGFVLSEARKSANEARRLALKVPYGRAGRDAQIAGCAPRVYELGPPRLIRGPARRYPLLSALAGTRGRARLIAAPRSASPPATESAR